MIINFEFQNQNLSVHCVFLWLCNYVFKLKLEFKSGTTMKKEGNLILMILFIWRHCLAAEKVGREKGGAYALSFFTCNFPPNTKHGL